MRPYEPAMTIKDGYWPKNVQYQFTGHIGQAVREQLPNLANCLHDWIRRWVYTIMRRMRMRRCTNGWITCWGANTPHSLPTASEST